jgi:hypothetical protein
MLIAIANQLDGCHADVSKGKMMALQIVLKSDILRRMLTESDILTYPSRIPERKRDPALNSMVRPHF